jgi:Cft2 family RNA processing exonuclease
MINSNSHYSNANIAAQGAILMGKNIICDGFVHGYGQQVSIFTHIHQDHLFRFESALGLYTVYVTEPTKDLLIELKHESPLASRNNLFGVKYNDSFIFNDETITLLPAQHILGSCQVQLKTSDEDIIIYTSDFDMPGTKPIECDTLIIDATHGSQEYVHNYDRSELIDQLLDVIDKELKQDRPVILKAHRGQLQEMMSIITQRLSSSIPFIAPIIEKNLANVYKNYGYKIREVIDMDSKDAKEIINAHSPYVGFLTRGAKFISDKKVCSIRISSDIAFGKRNDIPWYKVGNNSYSFNISNHTDFKGILEYIKQSNPKLVITDASRSYYANNLAKKIQTNLNIKAISLPAFT